MKLSFKKRPKETGLRAVGNCHPFVDIKGDGKNRYKWIWLDSKARVVKFAGLSFPVTIKLECWRIK